MTDLNVLAHAILARAEAALTAAGVGVGRAHVTPGAFVAWDECCEGGGQLWLRIVDVFPTAGTVAKFPGQDLVQGHGCSGLYAAHLAIGTVRCAHTVNDYGRLPSVDELHEDASRMLEDMRLLQAVLICDLPTLPGVANSSVNRWTPQGPEGGCAGGEWTFYVAYDPCACTDLAPSPEV